MNNETAARILEDCRWEIEREIPGGMWTKQETSEALSLAIGALKSIDGPVYSESDFEAFYSAYPRHEAVGDARKAFKAAKIDKNTLAKILSAIVIQEQNGIIKKGDKYTPQPAKWLRARRWEDESATRDSAEDGGIPWILPN